VVRNCITGLLAALLLITITSSFANEGNEPPKNKDGENKEEKTIPDTLPAFVMYGDHYILSGYEHTEDDVACVIDSILCQDTVDTRFIGLLQVYWRIRHMTKLEVVALIDSLFEAPYIPYSLVNQINLYVATHSLPDKHRLWFEDDTSRYPANYFYQGWNTFNPNPYTYALSDSDTVLQLPLVGLEYLGDYVPPILGPITSKFGWRDGRMHSGMDIDLQVWDTVVSSFPGMVRIAKTHQGYGRVVVVRHYNGLETTYGHLHRLKVKPGDIVEAGQLIGLGGSSGRSSGSHLHWEVRFKGIALNPQYFISFKTNELMNDTLMLRKIKWSYAAFPKGAEFHTVERGDFPIKVANRYGISLRKLKELNSMSSRPVLRVGQKLRVG